MFRLLPAALLLCFWAPLAAQDMPAEQHSLYVPGVSGAQMDFRAVIESEPMAAGNVYRMYDFDSPRPEMKAPKGYRPFYIAHYGRHGARYILKDEMYDYPYSVFSKAAGEGCLTELGRKAWETWQRIYPALKGKAGLLSADGEWQQRTLAGQMFRSYRRVFRRNSRVEMASTVVPRCIRSMEAFSAGLLAKDRKLDINMVSSDSTTRFLNAYYPQGNPDMTESDLLFRSSKGAWKKAKDGYFREIVDMDGIAARLFSDEEFIRKEVKLYKFVEYMYYCAVNLPCTEFDEEMFMEMFTLDDLCALCEADNYTYYLQKGRSAEGGDYSDRLSSGLLKEIVNTSDADIRSGSCGARLRFGHDGCIMGLFNVMGIGGWCISASDRAEVKNTVHSFDVPMASNIQMVFFRDRRGDVLMTFLYNGYPVTLPVEAAAQGFYRWEDVRGWLSGILARYYK